MSRTRVISIPIPDESRFLILVGGRFNHKFTEFTHIRIYLANTPGGYRKGKLMDDDARGGMCSYTESWELTPRTCYRLGCYYRILLDYLDRFWKNIE